MLIWEGEERRCRAPRLRSAEWRDEVILAQLPEHVRPLAREIADAFDAVERRAPDDAPR